VEPAAIKPLLDKYYINSYAVDMDDELCILAAIALKEINKIPNSDSNLNNNHSITFSYSRSQKISF
jgi:hypothetical protein